MLEIKNTTVKMKNNFDRLISSPNMAKWGIKSVNLKIYETTQTKTPIGKKKERKKRISETCGTISKVYNVYNSKTQRRKRKGRINIE